MSSAARHYLIAFLTGSMLMLPVLFGRAWVTGNDPYYHMAMARHPVELGMADSFPWLQWTIFQERFVNHHLGFQFLLAPFVYLSDLLTGDLLAGGQAALLFFSGCASLCFYRILALRGIADPLRWTALLGILPWHFWLRLSYVRAPIIALPMLLFAIELLLRRKPWALGFWALVFMEVYFGAVVFALLAGGLLAGFLLEEGLRRETVMLGLAMGIGLLAGLVIHPSFPHNIAFLKLQIFTSGLSAAEDIGNEWKSPEAWSALKMWSPLLLLWGAALISRLRGREPIDGASIGLLLVSAVFMALTCKARRFVEYAPVFLLLSAADLARFEPGRVWTASRPLLRLIATSALIICCLSGPLTTRFRTEPFFNMGTLRPAMDWLKGNSPQRALVLADDWDTFPGLFYLNRHNTYAVGLDPMFTARKFPDHWRRYREITRGRTPASSLGDTTQAALTDIQSVFMADYVLVEKNHGRLYQNLRNADDLFSLVYPPGGVGPEQPPLAIFKVLPPPVTP